MRTFVELVEKYVDPELCPYPEYKGKPYYSIKYIENGEEYVGYSTYNLQVMSGFLKKYFISSAMEKQEQDRWTPCKEKMPAKPFGCFVTVMDTNPITQEEFENILPYFAGWDGEQWNDADGEQIPCEVLAWRPLPKPYKLEE